MKFAVVFAIGCVFGASMTFAVGTLTHSPKSDVTSSTATINDTGSQIIGGRISLRVSTETLIDVVANNPERVKEMYLTTTGSSLVLSNDVTLTANSIAKQGELADVAKKKNVSFAWE